MKTETVDIHVGISWLMDAYEVSERIKSAHGTLISGREYKLIHDEGKDSWEVWGEVRDWDDPWHLVIRIEYPEGLSNVIVYQDYIEFEAILGDWMRELEYEGQQLVAVITDTDDWSTYRGGPVRTVPV